MHFFSMKVLISYKNFNDVCAFFQVMALCPTYDKLFPELMLNQFANAYMSHQRTMSCFKILHVENEYNMLYHEWVGSG